MSTLLDGETTTVVLDALDFEVPCSYRDESTHVAEAAATCRTCGNGVFACSGHLQRDREKWLVSVALGGNPRCKQCKTTDATFDAVFDVVPL